MTLEKAIELKAAVGRLMYSNNKDVRDYNTLIDFIESALRPVSREQVEDDLPLQYYPVYRKALRDLKAAIEQVGSNFRLYGMNNWKGMVAIIDMVLQDPEGLMCSASLEGYDIPEPYLTRWKKWQQKQMEKLEALKDGKGDND